MDIIPPDFWHLQTHVQMLEKWLEQRCVTTTTPERLSATSSLQVVSPQKINSEVGVQSNGLVGTELTDNHPGIEPEWLHDADAEPPPEYRYGPLVGTREQLGFAVRPKSPDPVDSKNAHRNYLKAKATGHSPRIWVKKTFAKPVEVYFRDENPWRSANQRLETWPTGNSTEVEQIEPKPNEVTSSKDANAR
ncbi:MAG: hypothetical protein ACKV2Q_14440 [Planctomycetaceae bacterium]